jgi:hypothetical protein
MLKKVVVPARQATQADEIDSSGLLKYLQIRAREKTREKKE